MFLYLHHQKLHLRNSISFDLRIRMHECYNPMCIIGRVPWLAFGSWFGTHAKAVCKSIRKGVPQSDLREFSQASTCSYMATWVGGLISSRPGTMRLNRWRHKASTHHCWPLVSIPASQQSRQANQEGLRAIACMPMHKD